jgi:hypothetical protein
MLHFRVATSRKEVFVSNFSKMTHADGATVVLTAPDAVDHPGCLDRADETMKTEWQRRCSLLMKRRIECTARRGKVFDATRTREHFTALVGKPTASYEVFEKYYPHRASADDALTR